MIEIKAKPRSSDRGAAIPDFLKLKPDEQEARVKKQLQARPLLLSILLYTSQRQHTSQTNARRRASARMR